MVALEICHRTEAVKLLCRKTKDKLRFGDGLQDYLRVRYK